MTDPLAQVTSLLQPSASFTKLVTGAGAWAVERNEVARPFYCAVLDGSVRLTIPEMPPIVLEAGDFVLLPFARRFALSSHVQLPSGRGESIPIELEPFVFRLGDQAAEPDMRMLIGYGLFGSADAGFLASLLPQAVHVHGETRLTTLVRLLDDESRATRPARDVVLTRLLEVLLIEALRASATPAASPGLLRGLSDQRLAAALRELHARPADPWTVGELAAAAGLSRSTFFERFRRTLGITPMEYLLHWRMLSSKNLLRRMSVAEVARRVGYGSTSAFSVAFTRYTSLTPTAYLREPVTD